MLSRTRLLALTALVSGAVSVLGLAGAQAEDQPPPNVAPTVNDWGEFGLLQDPSARMGPDGNFNFTYSHVYPYDRYNLMFTPLPFLQAGFRYSSIYNRLYGPASFSGSQSYKDRSVELKLRLTQESESLPETAIGVRDIAGTGLFGSEYFVATRRYYNFEFTAGVGWGLMGTQNALPNPFGALFKSFKSRGGLAGSGSAVFSEFHGQSIGLFGGFEYHTPIKNLSFKLELDSDSYQQEPLSNRFRVNTPINAALVFRPYPFIDLSAGVERGNTLMLRMSLDTNLNLQGILRSDTPPPKLAPRPEPPPPTGIPLDQSSLPLVAPVSASAPVDRSSRQIEGEPSMLGLVTPASGGLVPKNDQFGQLAFPASPSPPIRPEQREEPVVGDAERAASSGPPNSPAKALAASGQGPALPDRKIAEATPKDLVPTADQAKLAEQIFTDLKAIGFTGQSFAIQGGRAYLLFSQTKYRNFATAIGRAARIVAVHLPPYVERITLDIDDNGLTIASVSLQRHDLEQAVADNGSPEEVWANATISDSDPDRPLGTVNPHAFPSYTWALNPRIRQQLGGPNNFLIYEVYAELSGEATLRRGLTVDGALGVNLFNNLNSLTQTSDSVLPHVRSDIDKYLKQGKTGIFDLHSDYLFNIAPSLYGRFSAGFLEEMFAGVDGEILYRPQNRRWAVGLNVSEVYQRYYNELFGLLPYHVTTGYLKFYYKLPFYKLTAEVDVGRYLAGDKGATVQLSRQFDSGIRAGVFVTKTNVSASAFGEGSFDKGFFVTIPLDLLFGSPTRAAANYLYRPLTRDGGQQLEIAKPLYGETDGVDPEDMSKDWPHLLE